MLVVLPSTTAVACPVDLPEGHVLSGSERFTAQIRTVPRLPTVGEPFQVEIAVCGQAGGPSPQLVAVDADMPEHRHGMNYRARITETAPGRFRAAPLLFHMPGRWELIVEVKGGETTDVLRAPLEIE
jgi:hypothetical protein